MERLEELAAAHRPEQLVLLERLMDALTACDAVTHLMVRGSLASGTADRLSDLDLVVAVHDGQLPQLVDHLDPLLGTQFGALLPGWRDTIVGQLGGTGRVYLLPHAGHLLQLDLYVCPTSTAQAVQQRSGARVLWQSGHTPEIAEAERAQASLALEHLASAAPDCTALIVQAVVLHAMLRKRLRRGQTYIAFGLQHHLVETCRDLIRTALAPHSRHHGWYHLAEVGHTAAGRACLRELHDAVRQPAASTLKQADRALERILRIAQNVAPTQLAALSGELAAYRAYQEQEDER
ncbi:hypothetical protein [Actinacidiphila rubida]|uniref:hypothetical protein n=1 Tax=Actinacidiphila rubida TaxID=310780 RepID=UPI000942E660|nr:hypothetical protein [Actinacidiphila rubida]